LNYSYAQKNFIPQKARVWIDARKKYRLSHAHIQMARELDMNPDKFEKLANHRQEPWKAPLADYIEQLYFKRFGKRQPDNIRSIEQIVSDKREKKAAKRQQRFNEIAGNDQAQPTEHRV
jgi:hypothetical protein